MQPVTIAFLLGVAIAGWLLLRRANQLCVLAVEGGRCELESGRAPAALVDQIDDIAQRARLEHATFRVVVESGLPRLLAADDVPDSVVQQVRNCVGQYQVAQFRSGRKPE